MTRLYYVQSTSTNNQIPITKDFAVEYFYEKENICAGNVPVSIRGGTARGTRADIYGV